MDREQLEELIGAHQAEIYRYLRYLGADPGNAPDLVQDTFLAAFRSLDFPDLEDVPARTGWLRGIARNRFLMHCRRSRAGRVEVSGESLEQAESVWTSDFLRDSDGFDTLQALEACLETLPERERTLVTLRYREKKSRLELGRTLGMSEDGIKSFLRRVRDGLAACIEGKLGLRQG